MLRAVLAGQIAAAARHGDRDSVARAGELLRRQSNRRIRHVHDSADMVFVEPSCCYSGGDVDLVFVVAEKHADFFAERLAAEIFNSHVCGNHRALSGESGEEAGHIGQHADVDVRLARLLRAPSERPCCCRAAEKRDELAPS